MSWEVVYAKHAQKDAQKLSASGLKGKAKELLAIIKENPFQNPPARWRSIGLILKANQYSTSPRVRSPSRSENRQGSSPVVTL